MEIELVALRAAVLLSDVGQTHGTQRGNAKHGPKLVCSGCYGVFSLVVKDALQSRWRAIDGHFKFLPHNRYRHIYICNATKDIRDQITILKTLCISFIRFFIVSRAVNIVKYWARQTPSCQLSKVSEAMAIF